MNVRTEGPVGLKDGKQKGKIKVMTNCQLRQSQLYRVDNGEPLQVF